LKSNEARGFGVPAAASVGVGSAVGVGLGVGLALAGAVAVWAEQAARRSRAAQRVPQG
jgi:hypothetical protein